MAKLAVHQNTAAALRPTQTAARPSGCLYLKRIGKRHRALPTMLSHALLVNRGIVAQRESVDARSATKLMPRRCPCKAHIPRRGDESELKNYMGRSFAGLAKSTPVGNCEPFHLRVNASLSC